jgi:hypothetical protein
MPTLRDLSVELLPPDGPIADDYVNRMLLTSLMVSSASLHDSTAAHEAMQRFSSRSRPGIVLKLAGQWNGTP